MTGRQQDQLEPGSACTSQPFEALESCRRWAVGVGSKAKLEGRPRPWEERQAVELFQVSSSTAAASCARRRESSASKGCALEIPSQRRSKNFPGAQMLWNRLISYPTWSRQRMITGMAETSMEFDSRLRSNRGRNGVFPARACDHPQTQRARRMALLQTLRRVRPASSQNVNFN